MIPYMEDFSDSNHQTQRFPTAFAGSMLYFVTLSLMLISSSLFAGREIGDTYYYLFMFVIQLSIIALPPILYMLIRRIRMKETIRLHSISLPEAFLVIGMAFFGYLVIIALNLVWYWILSKVGTPQPPALPPIETGTQYFLAVLVIAVVPAAFEELLFRGVIQRGYERIGLRFSIVVTGILFALLHLSILSLPSILLLGIMLCYIVYRSNSILTGILYHFVNNTIAVTLAYIQSIVSDLFPMEGTAETLLEMPTETLMAGIIFWGIIGIVALGLFAACFAGFHVVTRSRRQAVVTDYTAQTKVSKMELIPAVGAGGVAIMLLVWEIVGMVKVG